MKTLLIKDGDDHKLRLKMNKCTAPDNLYHIQMTNESYNTDGDLTDSSNYEFFLTRVQVDRLINGLAMV